MAVMKYFLRVLVIYSFALVGIDGAKSKDEGRPYEFGFTIDGQQHRHERKDANGIIQGEFGFITADGVYHVTTYATDENGAFRILSMRNIKISGPLDGTKAGEYKTKPLPIGQAATQKPSTQTPKPQQQASPQNLPVKIQQAPVINQVQVTTRKPLLFTTQPTIKPACAGCGYVTRATTTKKAIAPTLIPDNQNVQPGFSKPVSFVNQVQTSSGGGVGFTEDRQENYRPNIGTQQYNNAGQNVGVVTHQSVQNYPSSAQNNIGGKPNDENNKQISIANSNLNGLNTPGSNHNVPTTNQFSSNIDVISPHIQSTIPNINLNGLNSPDNNRNVSNSNQLSSTTDLSRPFVQNNQNTNFDKQNNNNQYNPSRPNPNNVAGNFPTNKPNDFPMKNPSHSIVDDIKVENNAILVPNNPPIPIKDKYPGMVDGLPEGVTQTDISDILYKFNYTIGFHGHYERGLRNGTKIGGYFVNGRDGISRVVTYVADEKGFRPKFKLVNLGLDSPLTPKEDTEKTFGLQSFEFVWYPLK